MVAIIVGTAAIYGNNHLDDVSGVVWHGYGSLKPRGSALTYVKATKGYLIKSSVKLVYAAICRISTLFPLRKDFVTADWYDMNYGVKHR